MRSTSSSPSEDAQVTVVQVLACRLTRDRDGALMAESLTILTDQPGPPIEAPRFVGLEIENYSLTVTLEEHVRVSPQVRVITRTPAQP